MGSASDVVPASLLLGGRDMVDVPMKFWPGRRWKKKWQYKWYGNKKTKDSLMPNWESVRVHTLERERVKPMGRSSLLGPRERSPIGGRGRARLWSERVLSIRKSGMPGPADTTAMSERLSLRERGESPVQSSGGWEEARINIFLAWAINTCDHFGGFWLGAGVRTSCLCPGAQGRMGVCLGLVGVGADAQGAGGI